MHQKKWKFSKVLDKDTYRAVYFARRMIRDGESGGLAIWKASRYYGCDQSEVAHYLGELRRHEGYRNSKQDTRCGFYVDGMFFYVEEEK